MTIEAKTQETTVLSIGGMTCSGCVNTVRETLVNIKGVKEATVNLENESAKVSFNSDVAGQNAFEQALEDAGYEFRS